jgi:uncharacterized protein YabN with tetrapyrrole methylase and pyrophosphatase domain
VQRQKGSLTIVGTGITAIGQITLEAQAHIAQAGKVLYLVADPLTISWIRELNPSAEDLYPLYQPDRDRLITYYLMTDRILECVRSEVDVCAVFYGHPGVFVFPSHEALLRARSEGYEAQMLPAISAEDCLFADLGIDPGRAGCQSYEATDFLVHRRLIDTTCGLILWQIGIVGQVYNQVGSHEGTSILADTLIEKYGLTHQAIVYEAKHYPTCDPIILRVQLVDLASTKLTAISTLYVPPLKRPVVDVEVARRIGIPENFIHRKRDAASLYDPLEPQPEALQAVRHGDNQRHSEI